ncbi:hypothetical protein Droror1_Dr00003491 [Drosera rotundifolia]
MRAFITISSGNTQGALGKIHPSRPDWYEEFYAAAMNNSMKVYEAEVTDQLNPYAYFHFYGKFRSTAFSLHVFLDLVWQIASYKSKLFSAVRGKASEILEIGIGTGPNLKYYAGNGGMRVFGVDPNRKMEKYARAAAEDAGLPQENFEFLHAVGEDLPLANSSMDAVIGTLALCSVTDVKRTLGEVKRVLKPGGIYVFFEHVGAKDGTLLRVLQNILDPVQQFVADGCHLTRDTAKLIAEAEFSQVDGRMIFVSYASLINPHVYGTASK